MTDIELSLAVPPESTYRIDQLRDVLGEDERNRAGRFRHDADRHLYITAHALTRLALSRHQPAVEPQNWTFVDGQWGRPHPTNPETGSLQVNLSHTRGMTAVVIADAIDVGVDVEWARPDEWIFETVDTVFAPAEVESLLPLPEAERRERFFLYWTLKEAYIKARGMGVSLPLTEISFARTDDDAVRLDLGDAAEDDASTWRFERFQPAPDVRGAVAARTDAITLEVAWPSVT
ncbi:MAG: 4'-phosphopantetheinyl transferase superfamily protein [Actinomycetota bacterium]